MGEGDYDDIHGGGNDRSGERALKRRRKDYEHKVDDFSDGFRERDERSVHVRPIPAGMTKHELGAEFGVHGEVVHVQIVTDRRFAFVHFADINDAMAVKEMGSIFLGSQEAQIKPALPPGVAPVKAEERPTDGNAKPKGVVDDLSDGPKMNTEATIHISPVPETIQSKTDLSAELEVYGEVVHVHIRANRKCAFVHFADVDAAVAVREKGVVDIGGVEIKVKAANVPLAPGMQSEETLERRRQIDNRREVAQRFQDDSSDPHADLLSFFDNDFPPEVVDFVNSLTSDEASRVMELLVVLTESKKWREMNYVRDILESLDHAQVESMDIQTLEKAAQFNTSAQSKIEAIAKCLKQMGGKGDIGVIGSKFKVKRTELEEWGFILTPQAKGGQFTVTAPDDLVDIEVTARDRALLPPIGGEKRIIRASGVQQLATDGAGQRTSSSRRSLASKQKHNRARTARRAAQGDRDEDTTQSSATPRTRWGTMQTRGHLSRRAWAAGQRPAPPPPLAPMQTRQPAPASARAAPRPSMAPHIAARSMPHAEQQQKGQRRGREETRPHERTGPAGQHRPFSAF